jgi:monoamine oxidase
MWALAEEVKTERGILIGGGQAGVSSSAALAAFTKFYPGKHIEIEQTVVHDWSKEPWSAMCERIPYPLGELSRFWPEVIRRCGRVHFAGAYAAPMNWGQEAALESANRVAEAIHVD